MKFLFMAPPAFASGPAQYSSLWNLFISTILKIMKERLKIQASGPAGFTPWDRLNIPVCETSSSINPRFVTALEKVFLTFYMICKAGQNQKKNSGHQTNDVVFSVCFTFCGSAVFTRNRLTESEAESSWNYLSHPIDHYSSFRLTRLFESRLSKQEKLDPHTRYLEVLTKQFIRFLVPQLSLGTGLLNQKSNPHFITSVLMASYRFLNENFLSYLNRLWLIQESDPSESEAGSS